MLMLVNYQLIKPINREGKSEAAISLFEFDSDDNQILSTNFLIVTVKVNTS